MKTVVSGRCNILRSSIATFCFLAISAVADTKAITIKGAPAGVTYSSHSGETCEAAVIIFGAKETGTGIQAEKAWVSHHYPGFKFVNQSLKAGKDKYFDLIQIRTAKNESKDICFDITSFFGKL